jgi:ABC-2 type transport system permease protein
MATTRSRRGGLLEPFPIFTLTIRQFLSGKAVRVVALFALVPSIFALIFWLDAGGLTQREFMHRLFQDFIAPTILPIATLILATNALGNEVEDRTMVYLALKPISRARIILEKFAAVFAAAGLLLAEGLLLTYIIVMRGAAGANLDQLLAQQAGLLFGVLGYGALFLAVSLIVPRALVAGIMYTLLWESLFGRFIPGIRLISVRHYVQSIYVRIADDPLIRLSQAMQLSSAIIVLLLLTALTLALATWRLRTMNLE